MKTLKLVGFVIFVIGLCLKLWWLILIGIGVFEAGGITWMAAATSGHGHDHHDHYPGNHQNHGP